MTKINPALATLEALKGAKVTSNVENENKLKILTSKPLKPVKPLSEKTILNGRSFKISKNEETKLSKIRRTLEDTLDTRLSDNIIVRLAIARLSDKVTSEELEMIKELVSQDKRRKVTS